VDPTPQELLSSRAYRNQVRHIGDAIQIGRFTVFGTNVRLRTGAPGEKIVIGNYCAIGEDTLLMVGNNHRTDLVTTFPLEASLLGARRPTRTTLITRNTVVGHDVWIGMRACITSGAQVGSGAVVAAGAVVFGEVPPYAVVAGNPARVVRYRFSKPIVQRLLKLAWWDWPEESVRANLDWFFRPVPEFLDHFATQ